MGSLEILNKAQGPLALSDLVPGRAGLAIISRVLPTWSSGMLLPDPRCSVVTHRKWSKRDIIEMESYLTPRGRIAKTIPHYYSNQRAFLHPRQTLFLAFTLKMVHTLYRGEGHL